MAVVDLVEQLTSSSMVLFNYCHDRSTAYVRGKEHHMDFELSRAPNDTKDSPQEDSEPAHCCEAILVRDSQWQRLRA